MDIRNFFGTKTSKKEVKKEERKRKGVLFDSDEEKEKKVSKKQKLKSTTPVDFFASVTPKKKPEKKDPIKVEVKNKEVLKSKDKKLKKDEVEKIQETKSLLDEIEKTSKKKSSKNDSSKILSEQGLDVIPESPKTSLKIPTKRKSIRNNLSKSPVEKEPKISKKEVIETPEKKTPQKETPVKKDLNTAENDPKTPKKVLKTVKQEPETPENGSAKTSRKSTTPKKLKTPKKSGVGKTPKKSGVGETPKKSGVGETPEDVKAIQKRERFIKFKQYQQKLASGPLNPGSKEVPEGAENCLEGLTFVVTGIQESLSRDEIKSLIERYSGRMTSAVSGKTSYLITGSEPGESKTNKAKKLGTKIISEDEFLDLIRKNPKQQSHFEKKYADDVIKSKSQKHVSDGVIKSKSHKPDSDDVIKSEDTLMFVDKYKPKKISQIIGQQGAKSNLHKLKAWLQKWHFYNSEPGNNKCPKPKSTAWGGGDQTGASFKAALLSGPPGVGKTTTTTLVCQDLGLTYIELNASDKRSKRSLRDDVMEYLNTSSLVSALKKSSRSNHVLIMDEVDGMAGNEDRGGLQELIQLVKTTKIPIICMCNDRTSPKMRSFVNYCFDLRFQRPRVEQITGSMMSVCYRENIKIKPPALQALIRGCNQDVRQVLHTLNMIEKGKVQADDDVTYDKALEHARNGGKDVNLGLFEVARKLLSAECKDLSLVEKLNLFFMDYSMIPNFVQENFLQISSFASKGDLLEELKTKSLAADAILLGDLIDSNIRKTQSWSLLPTAGLLTTVLPCTYNTGHLKGMINFPSLFGKISTTGKNKRLLNEIKFHSSIATSGSTEQALNLDYMTYLKHQLTKPLVKQSESGERFVEDATKILTNYDLMKEDFDNLIELSTFSGKKNPLAQVDSKVKASFTRTFNKQNPSHHYSTMPSGGSKKRKAEVSTSEIQLEVDPVNQVSDEDDDDVMKLAVKRSKKKTTAPKKPTAPKKTAAPKKPAAPKKTAAPKKPAAPKKTAAPKKKRS